VLSLYDEQLVIPMKMGLRDAFVRGMSMGISFLTLFGAYGLMVG
jgi:hypothetical protein